MTFSPEENCKFDHATWAKISAENFIWRSKIFGPKLQLLNHKRKLKPRRFIYRVLIPKSSPTFKDQITEWPKSDHFNKALSKKICRKIRQVVWVKNTKESLFDKTPANPAWCFWRKNSQESLTFEHLKVWTGRGREGDRGGGGGGGHDQLKRSWACFM